MRVRDLPVPGKLKDSLESQGIVELFPPQAEAIEAGLLDGVSMVVSTATASGKTLLALLASVKAWEKGLKTIYLSPLRALTTEKADWFRKTLDPLGVKVAAVSRDYDSPEEWLRKMDVIVATYEKADSMVRHRSSWLKDVGLIVVDELHLVTDPERGPRLETAVTALMKIVPGAQRLGLSATITNIQEVSRWLGAKPLASEWRPVPLREAVYYDEKLHYADGDEVEVGGIRNPLVGLTVNTLLDGGQVMVFASSRRRAEDYALKLSQAVGNTGLIDRESLAGDAERIRAEGRGLEIAEKLASCVERGVAFHHAGLTHPHRSIVEEGFRAGRIKAVTATPTLAAGVNIPARTVIIPEVKKGAYELSVMEYKQIAGRAGRPGYDPYGEVITIASGRRKMSTIFRKYVRGRPEPVVSKLPEKIRWAILAALSSGIAETVEELEGFTASTLARIQGGSVDVAGSLESLRGMGLLAMDGVEVRLTRLGRRVAELCVEPVTALVARRLASLRVIGEDVMLAAVASCPDVTPIHMEVPLTGLEAVGKALETLGWDPGDSSAVAAKMVALKLWVNEVSEQRMNNTYGVAPGDLLVLRESAEWVSSALSELLLVLGRTRHSAAMLELSERVRHGVRPELIQLCSIEGVGRVRARMLYNAGLRTVEDVANADVEALAGIPGIGREVAVRAIHSARRLLGRSVET